MTPLRLTLIALAATLACACSKPEDGGEASVAPESAQQPTPGDATASADSMAAVEAAMAASPSAVPLTSPSSSASATSE